jgi:hypothetical protein
MLGLDPTFDGPVVLLQNIVQVLHRPVPTTGFAKLRSVELVGDELPVPGQQSVSDLSQRSFFGIG